MYSYLSECVGQTVAFQLTGEPLFAFLPSEDLANYAKLVRLERLVAVDTHGMWVERVGSAQHQIPRAKTIRVLVPWSSIQDIAVVMGPPVDSDPVDTDSMSTGPQVLVFPAPPRSE